jgi:hypothetical protein
MSGYGCVGGLALLGFVQMEIARLTRPATFVGTAARHGFHLHRRIGGTEAEMVAADGAL